MPESSKEKAICKEFPASDMESSYAPSTLSSPPPKQKWMFFNGIFHSLKKKSNQELLESNSQCNEAVLPDIGRILPGRSSDNISVTFTSFTSESTDTRPGAMTSAPVDPHGRTHGIV